MCFSAGASFGASAVLGSVGILAIRKTTCASQVLFAGIPLIFAAQQFTEGLVWLSLSNPHYGGWEDPAARSFLLFAEVVWPLWAPLALLALEPRRERKPPLWVLTGAGLAVSLYFLYYLAAFPVQAQISAHHVRYQQDLPLARFWFSGIFYVVPTVGPLLLSQVKGVGSMGVFLLASYGVAYICYVQCLTSVWCFFAALISMQVLWIVAEFHRNTAREKAFRLDHPPP